MSEFGFNGFEHLEVTEVGCSSSWSLVNHVMSQFSVDALEYSSITSKFSCCSKNQFLDLCKPCAQPSPQAENAAAGLHGSMDAISSPSGKVQPLVPVREVLIKFEHTPRKRRVHLE